jgi:hypothetical protein
VVFSPLGCPISSMIRHSRDDPRPFFQTSTARSHRSPGGDNDNWMFYREKMGKKGEVEQF